MTDEEKKQFWREALHRKGGLVAITVSPEDVVLFETWLAAEEGIQVDDPAHRMNRSRELRLAKKLKVLKTPKE